MISPAFCPLSPRCGRALTMAVAAMLLAASCASVGEPDAGQPPSTASFVTATAEASVVEDELDAQVRVPLPASTVPPVATTVPERFDGALLLAGRAGVTNLAGDVIVAAADPLVGVRAVVVDDLQGGVVVLNEGDGAQSIEWIPALSDARQLLLGPELALHDVAVVETDPVAVVTSRDAASGAQVLQLVALETGAASVVTTLAGADATTVSVSFGGGVFGVVRVGPGCPGLDLIDTAGRLIDAPAVPDAICEAGAARPIGLVDIAPDGLSMAYTQQIVDVETGRLTRTEVVVRDLQQSDDVLRVEVGGASVTVSALDWNGRHLAMAFVAVDGSEDNPVEPVPLPPRVIDSQLPNPQPQSLAVGGVFGVALARVPVTVRADL
ncbi:MAG: hypothetical protein GY713_21335 [Actinomycetia bacterium]|nr:hypothetical protein [Actinomycetes bacterium]